MALLISFFKLTSIFFLATSSAQFELQRELFSCFKYIGIPIDTLKHMSVRNRKFYIREHNRIAAEEEAKMSIGQNNRISGNGLNAYAKMDMARPH